MAELNTSQIQEIVDAVMGLRTSNESFDSTLDALAASAPIEWHCALCWAFSFLACTGFTLQGINADTNAYRVSTLERIAPAVIVKLNVRRYRRIALGLIKQKHVLSRREVAVEFDTILNDIEEELRQRLRLVVADKPVGSPVSFTVLPGDPLIEIIAVVVETVLCKRLGFAQGALISANLYGMVRLFVRIHGPSLEAN